MSSNKILVTYTSSPAFLSTDHWKQVHAALLCQFPLRTLHWKSPSRANIETIPQVDVNLVPLESLRDEHTSQIPQSLLDKPLLNVYFVVCDVRIPFVNHGRALNSQLRITTRIRTLSESKFETGTRLSVNVSIRSGYLST